MYICVDILRVEEELAGGDLEALAGRDTAYYCVDVSSYYFTAGGKGACGRRPRRGPRRSLYYTLLEAV